MTDTITLPRSKLNKVLYALNQAKEYQWLPEHHLALADTKEAIEILDAALDAPQAASDMQADADSAARALFVQAVNNAAPQPAPTLEPLTFTHNQILSACLSYRHDFGLLDEKERDRIVFTAKEWLRAFNKEAAHAAKLKGGA